MKKEKVDLLIAKIDAHYEKNGWRSNAAYASQLIWEATKSFPIRQRLKQFRYITNKIDRRPYKDAV